MQTVALYLCYIQNLFMPYVNNKGSDQTVHPHSLISNIVDRCFDSIIPIVAKPKVSSLLLRAITLSLLNVSRVLGV